MRCVSSIAIVFLSIGLAAEQPTGVISGRVRITTKLTRKRITIPQVYDRLSAVTQKETPADAGGELRRVVVFLESSALPANPIRATIDQRHRRFEPEITTVPVGSVVLFPNSDPIFHNVFSISKAKQFDLGNYAGGDSRSVTFTKPGLIQLHCHLHPNMNGAILVTPNGWTASLEPDGSFALPPVPPGRYTVVVWHKSAGFFRRTVDVPRGGNASADFDIPSLELATTR